MTFKDFDQLKALRVNAAKGLHTNLLLRRSRKLWGVAGKRWWNYFERYNDAVGRMHAPRLTAEDVLRMSAEEAIRSSDFVRRSTPIKPETITAGTAGTTQEALAVMVHNHLTANPHIRTIANIGGRVDTASNVLALLHPDRRFISIDFQLNLSDINALLPRRDNVEFVPGYALDVFESGTVKADVIMMNSTACLFTYREFDAYCGAWNGADVIMNEAWHVPAGRWNFFRVPVPENIASEIPPLALPNNIYLHNYPFWLEKNGYSVHGRLDLFDDEYRYKAVATR